VVISKSSTEIKIAPRYTEAEKKVCKASGLLKKIQEIEKYYNEDYFDHKTIVKVKKLLLNKHTPLRSNILRKFGIDESELITGVRCPKCKYIPMHFKWKKWHCPECQFVSEDAHLKAINDYFLLIKTSIKNSELCKFLQIPSTRTASYLLSKLNFPQTGTNKGRVYHQPQSFPISSNHVFPPKNKH
jgi:hypothetical protein